MRRISSLFCIIALLLFPLAACTTATLSEDNTGTGTANEQAGQDSAVNAEESQTILLMAAADSVAETGLLDYLAPVFGNDTGFELRWNAVSSEEALEMGRSGMVDVVLTGDKASGKAFVADGYGVKRFPVMYSDFIVVGPAAPIAKTSSVASVFKEIVSKNLPFLSRGDGSETNQSEKAIWATLELDPTSNINYMQSGQGMSDTITMANSKNAYCFTDRETWLSISSDLTAPLYLNLICEGDELLQNQYGVIAVNQEKYPNVNQEAANAFIDWICSEETQNLIGEYGVNQYDQALFTPNAGTVS